MAGLTLGIGLRRSGIPVTVVEAGRYPRHRVCGEFISGCGQKILERLGLLEALSKAGARPAETLAFYSDRTSTGNLSLPSPALCCSRFCLDAVLAREFQNLGGELKEGTRWTGPIEGAGLIRATGRRIHSPAKGWRWFGLKVHARQVALDADLEMHFHADAYIGLCRLDDDQVNICGMFRRRTPEPTPHRTWKEQLRGQPGSILFDRLAAAALEESSFCAVAGLGIEGRCTPSLKECCVGDALGMIAPMAGNGMSMAFETADAAIGPLSDYSRNGIDWQQAQRVIGDKDRRLLRRRLNVAAWLHTAAFWKVTRLAMIRLLRRRPGLLRWFFFLTR